MRTPETDYRLGAILALRTARRCRKWYQSQLAVNGRKCAFTASEFRRAIDSARNYRRKLRAIYRLP